VGPVRAVLLWASQNETLRTRLPRYRFVRAAVRRFMPGEALSDALGEAKSFAGRGLPTTLTHLGENVTTLEQAAGATEQYLGALEEVAGLGLDTEISVKLSHLGFDVDPPATYANVERLAVRARDLGNRVWIDMESSAYVEGTLDVYRSLRARFDNLGICLQAYLRRTPEDLAALLPLGASVRLVKGAYREPPDLLVGRRAQVKEAFFRLAMHAMPFARTGSGRLVLATHDLALLARVEAAARDSGVGREAYEVQMLYGIRQADQFRLLGDGYRVRTLIAYGSHWYPWYVRRLAERPANVFFVLRNLFRRPPAAA
jgi:proline dehydrogenase